MTGNKKSGIVIQARYSSTRLPGKLFMPFYEDKNLIEVFLSELIEKVNHRYPIVLATSTNSKDDVFISVAASFGIDLFRGKEDDVLDRILQAAITNGFSSVIRVCADNPIYDIESTIQLLSPHHINQADYTSFRMSNGIPTIKSHLGLWGEVVAVDALAKAIEMTQEKVYHEHVTNFLYSNPQSFKIQLIDAPMGLSDRDDLRFTVDELEDFEMMKAIYNKLKSEDNHIKLNQLIGYVSNQTDYLLQMKRQIQKNKK